jgi:hypothetical protein
VTFYTGDSTSLPPEEFSKDRDHGLWCFLGLHRVHLMYLSQVEMWEHLSPAGMPAYKIGTRWCGRRSGTRHVSGEYMASLSHQCGRWPQTGWAGKSLEKVRFLFEETLPPWPLMPE